MKRQDSFHFRPLFLGGLVEAWGGLGHCHGLLDHPFDIVEDDKKDHRHYGK